MFNEYLFQGTSFVDLLQTTPDVSMLHYNMSDDESLDLPPMLPTLMTSELSPTGGSVNVLDMINQDILLGDNLQSTISNASTEAIDFSQYAASSAAPFTSAGDVFLPAVPITTVLNTFVKSTASGRTTKVILKANPRRANPTPVNPMSTNPTLTNQIVIDTFGPNQQMPWLTRSQLAKSRNTSAKSSSKKSSTRSQDSQSAVKTSSGIKSQSARTRSIAQSILLISSPPKSAFVSASTLGGTVRSTPVTHTITQTADIVTEPTVALATETVTYTTTVEPAVSQRAAADTWSSLKTDTVTSFSATRTQSPVTGGPSIYDTFVHSNSSTTSAITSSTITKPRECATITSPMQSTYTCLPTSILYSTPTIITRTSPAAGAGARPTAASPVSERAGEQFTILPSQTAYAIPASGRAHTPPKASPDASPSRTRLVIPMSLNTYANSSGMSIGMTTNMASNMTTKSRIAYSVRPTQSACAVTTSTSLPSTAAATQTLAQSTFALTPGAALYTAKKFPSAKPTRSRSVSLPTESQTLTIVDGKGSYTTLTISSDFASTCSSLVVAQTQSYTAVTAVGTQTSSITSDSISRPRNQLLIPIANSQMNTSTSLGYLVTSPIGSDIISTHSSSGAVSNQSVTTTAIGSHTITTISTEALNRIRSRLLIPVPHNVPRTAAGLSSLPASTIATDSCRNRGPVTIITNQLISAAHARDRPRVSTTASQVTTSARTLFSGASTQGLFAITSHSSSMTAAEPSTRPLNRVVIPIIPNIHATSCSQSSTATATSNMAIRSFHTAPTQGTYIIATGKGSATSPTRDTATRPSHVVIPIMHNTSTATAALTSTTVATTTAHAFQGPAGSAYTSSIGPTDIHSNLPNRLIVQVTTTGSSISSITKPITAFTITRTRAPQSVYAIPPGLTTYTSSIKPSDATIRNPATMTLITFATTSATSPTTSGAHCQHGGPLSPTTFCSVTTATPTLANTGNRYVIKLAMSPGASTTTSVSSVTTAVTTPITSAVLSPPDHQFLEPHPVSRLRTFPGPRTYSVAQRSAAGYAPQRPPTRNTTRATPKKIVTSPAPLQIFKDVVCPPTNVKNQKTAVTNQGQSKSRFTLSHSSGNSTLVVPNYKNTVFKNLSTTAHPNPERVSSRFLNSRASSDRFMLNRSVAFVSPRRSAPGTNIVAQSAPTTTTVTQSTPARTLRVTYSDIRLQAGRATPAPAVQSATSSCNASNNASSLDEDVKKN